MNELETAAKEWYAARSEHPIRIDRLANAEYELVKAVKKLEA